MIIRHTKRFRAWLAMRDTERKLQAVIDQQHNGNPGPIEALTLVIERRDLCRRLAQQRAAYAAQFKRQPVVAAEVEYGPI